MDNLSPVAAISVSVELVVTTPNFFETHIMAPFPCAGNNPECFLASACATCAPSTCMIAPLLFMETINGKNPVRLMHPTGCPRCNQDATNHALWDFSPWCNDILSPVASLALSLDLPNVSLPQVCGTGLSWLNPMALNVHLL